jgi:outer membrane protein
MKNQKRTLWSLCIWGLALFPLAGFGQKPLDQYIAVGLQNNIVLQQKGITLEKAMLSLKTASSYFMPSVNLNASFSSAQGGRYASLPVGDLLNPVYATLNQMTGTNNFPTIENAQIDFLPKNYYDAYVRTSVPLLNTDLIHNRRIEQQKIELQEFEVSVYERELVKNIKVAYYNYLTALEAEKIYTSALALVNRNVAVNQSLVSNGKGLNTSLLRSQSELENVKAQINEAQNQVRNAQSYFNFLLNREATAAIEADETIQEAELTKAGGLLLQTDISKREELEMIKKAETIQTSVVTMNKQYWVPKLNAFLDLGSQAVNWEFSDKSRYYMVGVNLGIPIFNGFRNVQKVQQAGLDLKMTTLNYQNTTQQLSLSAQTSRNNLATAIQNHAAAAERLKSAESYFNLIDKGYKEGIHSLIEFIDANNQLTASRLQVSINAYTILSAMAQLERETATYALPE